MNVGVGVGDFIKILELAIKARKRFVDAPRQYEAISTDLRNFSNVVQDIDILLSGWEPEIRQRENLQRISAESICLLNDLLARLDKYRDIGSSSKNMAQCAMKAWKRLNWDQNDVQDFRGRLSLYLDMLNSVERQLHSQRSSRIEQEIHHLTVRFDRQERYEIFDWIGTLDHGSRQSNLFDQHEEGTGEWFLSSDKFQEWIRMQNGMLFCPGLPGAGKTVLASIVIQHLLNLFGNDGNTGIAYHYCEFKHQDNETVSNILSNILKQLVQCLCSIPGAMSTFYNKHKDKSTRPSLKEITSVLKTVACLHYRVFIVIDGLDECLVWRDLMVQLRGLQGANILATCRAIPEIVNDKELEGSSVLEVHARDSDVRKYLNRNMSRLRKFVTHDQQLQDDICKAILGASGGMFLLARLHLDSLEDKFSVGALRDALTALPTGSSAYDEAYQDAMKRIESQHPERRAIAKDVLAWLTFAKRPLKIEELRTAVIIQETDSNIDAERLIAIEDLVSVCAGLVTIDEQYDRVTLIHYTTEDYLKRTRATWRPNADAEIATSCLTYLLFPTFDVEFSELDDYLQRGKAWKELYPLLDYSMDHGTLHARLAVVKPPSVARFLSADSKVTKNLLLLKAKYGNPQGEDAAEWLIQQGVCTDVRDTEGRTAVHYAVINGWRRCVQLLLERGASLDSDVENMTPLHYTVKSNKETIVQAFLSAGIPVDTPVVRRTYIPTYRGDRVVYVTSDGEQSLVQNSHPEKGLTTLHLAALTGSQRMTKFLLTHGANPNFPSESGETPLHLALRRDLYGPRWPGIVDFWNDPDNRIECVLDYIETDDDEDEYCSVQACILEERLAVIEILLECPDVDVNAQDIFGISSLHIAVGSKYLSDAATQKLIDKGANISLRTKENKTPLHFAVMNRNMDVVSKLLALGADPMDEDVNGLNALHYAAQEGHLEILQDVLRSIPDFLSERFLGSKDKNGQNVLHHLLSNDGPVDIAVARYLLERFNGINDLDKIGMSPAAVYLSAFVLCAYQNDHEILDLLFQYGADPDFKTAEGLGLAHLVASSHRFSVGVLQALARWGVSLGSMDEQGRTTLHHSSIKGTLTEDVLDYLCKDRQLSVDLCDVHGKTAWDYAVEKKHEDHDPNLFDPDRWARAEMLLRGPLEEA